jgi:membrane protease YdiL (CAAX protease family)
MHNRASGLLAVAEVLLVMFGMLKLIGAVLMSSDLWQTAGPLQRNMLGHAVMMAVPVVWLVLTRRDLAAFGLWTRSPREDLTVALTIFLPVSLAGAVSGMVDYRAIPVSFLLAGVSIAALAWVAVQLRRGPDPQSGVITIALCLFLFPAFSLWRGRLPDPGDALTAFVCYAFFVGFGEEIMYRGFVQSRLNQAFGRPFTFFGVPWGWGLVLTSLLFGFTHVLNVDAATGQTGWYWGWGLWTTFGGLTFGYVRERTGNVLAPALLHGLPQALAASLLVLS